MDKFEAKLKKKKEQLELFVSCYGHNNYRAFELRREVSMYEKVQKMSYEEVDEQISRTAGEIAKVKLGFCENSDLLDRDRRLLKILTERVKVEKQKNKQKTKKMNKNNGVEIKNNEIDN